VFFVPSLPVNLLSVSAVESKGKAVHFEDGVCKIQNKNGTTLLTASKRGRLYLLDGVKSEEKNSDEVKSETKSDDKALIADGKPKNTVSLWHQRMGHLNVPDVKRLADAKMATGVKYDKRDEIDFCEACVKGKSQRKPFPKKATRRAEKPLQLIHSDVCGPMRTQSIGGARYFVTFIDDCTRYVTAYLMKKKSETLEKFQEYQKWSENFHSRRIQILRSDNGSEYINNDFKRHLRETGISPEFSTPYSSQQNGVPERQNRTLAEMARAMLNLLE
jgi:transposase InsO family protein